jgi:hypothetical protein
MKFYVSEQTKRELEAEISELKNKEEFGDVYYIRFGKIQTLEELLSNCVVLPVEKSWDSLEDNVLYGMHEHMDFIRAVRIDCPKGVIIEE